MYKYVLEVLYNIGYVNRFYFYDQKDAVEIKTKLDRHIKNKNRGELFCFEYNGESYSLNTSTIVSYGTQCLEKEYQLKYTNLYNKYTMEQSVDEQLIKDRRERQEKEIKDLADNSG